MPSFEETLIPLLPSAYNLARWIVRNDHDAEDCVQDAYLRAFKVFDRFRGDDGRAWLLTIVRNVCYSRLRLRLGREGEDPFDENLHGIEPEGAATEARLRSEVGAELLNGAMEALADPMREIIVLHDLEGLAYKEIAEVVGIPMGTVMSRLARARKHLQRELVARLEKEVGHG
jgi:RNA polymerase sigma-70 factor (ECF subfamily)